VSNLNKIDQENKTHIDKLLNKLKDQEFNLTNSKTSHSNKDQIDKIILEVNL